MQIRMHRSSYATAEQTHTLSGEREAGVSQTCTLGSTFPLEKFFFFFFSISDSLSSCQLTFSTG